MREEKGGREDREKTTEGEVPKGTTEDRQEENRSQRAVVEEEEAERVEEVKEVKGVEECGRE